MRFLYTRREGHEGAALVRRVLTAGAWAVVLSVAATAHLISAQDSGVIRGVVTDAITGKPLAGARVDLHTVANEGPQRRWDRPSTDANGRFEFDQLPAGEFVLEASARGFDTGYPGRWAPGGYNASFELAAGQRLTDVAVRLWPFGVIEGQVLDERGRAFPGLTVLTRIRSMASGTPSWVVGLQTAVTDEDGRYRLTFDRPTQATVCVTATATTVPMPTTVTPSAERRLAPILDRSRGRTLMSPDGRYLTEMHPLPPSTGTPVLTYVPTCAPNVPWAEAGEPLSVRNGETMTAPTLHMIPRPATHVKGRLIGPRGPIANAELVLDSGEGVVPTPWQIQPRALTASDGRFAFMYAPVGASIARVATEDRTPSAAIAPDGLPRISWPQHPMASDGGLWIHAPYTITGTETRDVLIEARAGVALHGTATGIAPDPRGEPPSVNLSLSGPSGEVFRTAAVDNDGRFTAVDIPPGRYTVQVHSPRLPNPSETLTLNGRDLIDRIISVGEEGLDGLHVAFAQSPSHVAGTVHTATGDTPVGTAVAIFPADEETWTVPTASPARMRSALVVKGRYSFEGLPPGVYVLAAIPDHWVDDWTGNQWRAPETLVSLKARGTTITLGLGDTRTVPLRFDPPR